MTRNPLSQMEQFPNRPLIRVLRRLRTMFVCLPEEVETCYWRRWVSQEVPVSLREP